MEAMSIACTWWWWSISRGASKLLVARASGATTFPFPSMLCCLPGRPLTRPSAGLPACLPACLTPVPNLPGPPAWCSDSLLCTTPLLALPRSLLAYIVLLGVAKWMTPAQQVSSRADTATCSGTRQGSTPFQDYRITLVDLASQGSYSAMRCD